MARVPKTKLCSTDVGGCGKRKPRGAFGKHPKARDGLQPTCGTCAGERLMRGRRAADRQRAAAAKRARNGDTKTPPRVADAVRQLLLELQRAGYGSARLDADTGEAELEVTRTEKIKIRGGGK